MPDSYVEPPYGLLWAGIFILFLAMVYTYAGKAWICFQGWAYRAEEPKRYWSEVATYYLLGLGLIGYFLYKFYGP